MKKRIIIGIIVLVVSALIIWGVVASRSKPATATVKATSGDISSSVLITGTTKPSQSVDLSFERTGKVSAVYVKIGDQVRVGQSLVELEKGDIYAQLNQAQASVMAAKARLDEIKSGARPEQVAISEVNVASAQISINQAQQTLFDALNDAYAKADDAMRAKTDENFTNPRTAVPTLNFRSINEQYQIDLPNKKAAIEIMLVAWKSSLDSLAVGSGLTAASSEAQKNLSQIRDFLDELLEAHNFIIPGSTNNVTAWKANAVAARSEVGMAVSSLAAAENGLRNAQSALTLAQRNLDLVKAGSTAEQVAAQQAVVAQAEANVQGIQVSLSKTVLRSPIDGVITVQGAKLGQIVTVTTSAIANSSLISIISLKKLQIEAYAPEVDVARLVIGQPVKITFDALQGETFNGSVMEIDPAETVVDGVVNYKIKVALQSDDVRIKSGLTANLIIETATKKGVVLLPQYTILQNDTGTYVRVPDGNTTKDIPVKLGIRGQDGFVEIVSGLSAGDDVLNIGLK